MTSRLEELIAELCPNGVEYKKIGDIGKVSMCKRILKNQTNPVGDIPFYKIGTFGKKADSFISNKLFQEYKQKYSFPNKGDILISAAGTIGRVVVYDGEPAYFQDSNIVWVANDEKKILNSFLYYIYQLEPWKVSSGGTISRLYNENIAGATIPVPPLEVQSEIVRILDTFTELTAELTARKKQYEYYRDTLLTFNDNNPLHSLIQRYCPNGVEYKKLGDIATLSRGKVMSKSFINDNPGEYPVYSSQTENNGQFGAISTYMFDGKYVTWTTDGANAGTVFYRDGKFNVTNVCGVIDISDCQVDTKYMYYALTIHAKNYVSSGMGNAKLMSNVMSKVTIPVPPLEVQHQIVQILDRFDALCNDLTQGLPAEIEARRKQYEYYRDQLLTFKRA